MKVYLVQHGEALAKDVDPGRPLSPQGEEDVRRVAAFLEQAGVGVERVLHSGKMRARQTADILAAAVLARGEAEAVDGIAPNDPVDVFSPRLHKLNADTAIVGHLPFMARLAAYLVSSDAEADILAYQPGGVACLEQDEEGRWRIAWMLRPELLQR